MDLFGKTVGVLDALDVTAGAGIPVGQPSPAEVFGLLENSGMYPELPQPVQRVRPENPARITIASKRAELGMVTSRHLPATA
jgi:hypothetical protein